MVLKIWREWRFPVEFALLLALAFFLPLREAPKNLLWLAYVVTWLVNRVWAAGAARDFGGPWDRWDSLFLAWLSTGYLAALFAGIRTPEANEWGAVNDLVRYISLGWCVRRARYTRAQALTVLGMLVASAALATCEAWWNWKVLGLRRKLELVSVGHVNHSAIYLVICLGAGFGALAAYWRSYGRVMAAVLTLALLLVGVGSFIADSRAAAGVALMLLLLVGAALARGLSMGWRAWLLTGALLVAALGFGGVSAFTRHFEMAPGNVLTERDLIWNRALVAVRANPLFGVGMDNFSRITDARLKEWLDAESTAYDAAAYVRSPHAHSLYINTLTERGAVGLAVLLAVLTLWGHALWRLRPRAAPAAATPSEAVDAALVLACWCAALSGWFVTVAIGFVNTTMHHEHAMLAVLTLALWIGSTAPPLAWIGSAAPPPRLPLARTQIPPVLPPGPARPRNAD